MTWGQIRAQIHAAHPNVDIQQINSWINEGYEAILSQRDWNGLKSSMMIQTGTPYQTGTIALTEGSLSIAGTGTAWTPDMTGLNLWAAGRNETYQFQYVSPTSGLLDRRFEGGTGTAYGYKLFQQDYELPQVVKNVSQIFNPRLTQELKPLDYDELKNQPLVFGEPMFYAKNPEEGENPTVKSISLYPVPESFMGLKMVFYKTAKAFVDNTGDTPLPWVSPSYLINYGKAMGYAPGSADSRNCMDQAVMFAMGMHSEENRKTPPTRIKVASRYTRHERGRSQW